MKIVQSLLIIVITAIVVSAQPKAMTAADFKVIVAKASSETNKAFPFVFTVLTETYEIGKLVSTETYVDERQAPGVERQTKTLATDGKTLKSYSIMLGFGNHTYCSSDGRSWRGPQQFVCPGPDGSGLMRLYGPREPESVEYTVESKNLNGQKSKIYREYSVYSSSDTHGKKDFRENITTIGPNDFFISFITHEGSLDSKTVTLVRTQTWDFKTKIRPVVAPK